MRWLKLLFSFFNLGGVLSKLLGKRAAKKAGRKEQRLAQVEETVQVVKESKDVEAKIKRLDDAAVTDELLDKWSK